MYVCVCIYIYIYIYVYIYIYICTPQGGPALAAGADWRRRAPVHACFALLADEVQVLPGGVALREGPPAHVAYRCVYIYIYIYIYVQINNNNNNIIITMIIIITILIII